MTPPGGESGQGGEGGPRTAVLIAGGATAGAALVAGVIFTVVANGKAGDAEELRAGLAGAQGAAACTGGSVPAECAELEDAIGGKDAFGNLALWSFAGAGVVGVGTLVFALTAPEPTQGPARATGARTSRVRAAPWATADGGGVWVTGTW